MAAERFEVEERWPELFEPLDDLQRRSVVQSLAASWHEGWVPNREDVADLAARASGEIDRAEFLRRGMDRARRTAHGPAVVASVETGE